MIAAWCQNLYTGSHGVCQILCVYQHSANRYFQWHNESGMSQQSICLDEAKTSLQHSQ